ncbi:armadillo-type protein [Schizophyllum commune]
MPSWENPIQSMADVFGANPATVPALLQFLTVLPEELMTNTRIPVTDDEYRERSRKILTDNSTRVLELLSMYISATGLTAEIQNAVFTCLRSWLMAGEISIEDFILTPLFPAVFEALNSDQLFDAAADAICEIIHETQEINDNMTAIERIVPLVISLKPMLAKHSEDTDRIRGYARIFAEAGECYRALILQHPETFFPIVEALGECSAFPDLDIVPITFPFWMRLAQAIGKRSSVPPPFLDAYRSLMTVIIRHLHFPPDSAPLKGQEADDFRSFRHVMGDTLKDCCYVLKAETCLMAAYNMITAALAQGPNVAWQEIEAPLFAMRSMGAEIDPNDDNAVPKILELIPSLPTHPRIRYAALLIIGRYSQWTSEHPTYLPPQLQYISAGFEDPDLEVCSAAGHALKYICCDCKQHLVDFLPTLHTFVTTTGSRLMQEDRSEVYRAIAFVISAMPMVSAGESLRTFSFDILAKVHAVTAKQAVTKDEMQEVCDGLENLETMLSVVGSFGEELPPACQKVPEEGWSVLDPFLAKYGTTYDIAERANRVLRHCITFFDRSALPVIASVVARLTASFDAAGFASNLWIIGKVVHSYGDKADATIQATFRDAYERSTTKIGAMLQASSPGAHPDVLEDYLHFLLPLLDRTPDVFFRSNAFPLAFQICMASLTVVHTEVLVAALEVVRDILSHDCLSTQPTAVPTSDFPVYATAIQDVLEKNGQAFVACVLSGMIGDFPEDCLSSIIVIFRMLASVFPAQMSAWIQNVAPTLPVSAGLVPARQQFVTEITTAINSGQYDKAKYAIISFHRASRKVRDRRRDFELK